MPYPKREVTALRAPTIISQSQVAALPKAHGTIKLDPNLLVNLHNAAISASAIARSSPKLPALRDQLRTMAEWNASIDTLSSSLHRESGVRLYLHRRLLVPLNMFIAAILHANFAWQEPTHGKSNQADFVLSCTGKSVLVEVKTPVSFPEKQIARLYDSLEKGQICIGEDGTTHLRGQSETPRSGRGKVCRLLDQVSTSCQARIN